MVATENDQFAKLQSVLARHDEQITALVSTTRQITESLERLDSLMRSQGQVNWGNYIAAGSLMVAVIVALIGGTAWGFVRDLNRLEREAVAHEDAVGHPALQATVDADRETMSHIHDELLRFKVEIRNEIREMRGMSCGP